MRGSRQGAKAQRRWKTGSASGHVLSQTGITTTENEIASVVVDAAFEVHTRLGPGLLESGYETVLSAVLRRRGLKIERQVPIPIGLDDLLCDEGFRADLLVEGKVFSCLP